MRKFTAFTLLLTVIIIVVLAEIVMNDYLPNLQGFSFADDSGEDLADNGQASVLGLQNKLGTEPETESEKVSEEVTEELIEDPIDTSELSDGFLPIMAGSEDIFGGASIELDEDNINGDADSNSEVFAEAENESVPDFEDVNYVNSSNTAYLRDEQLRSAGFIGAHLEDEPHQNNLFKTISIEDLYDTQITKLAVKTDTALLAKVYIFKVGIEADVNEIYQLILLRSTNSINVQINETNEYGSGSFYMNDPARNETAFLTVRIGGLIYAFSYPKEYHSQIKNLIKLLEWELQ